VRQADALLPKEIAYWIECQDEHFDGTGFPRGLKGEEIPLPSRIIAVAREFVRLTISSDGSDETKTDSALRSLRSQSGTLYDPSLVGSLEKLATSEPHKYH
jgi:response regulator RpfG family c-di-GMP phosphodiesterase